MKVIGLTGGIATGKSTVSETIKQEGVAVVDCDKIAHDVARKVMYSSDCDCEDLHSDLYCVLKHSAL